MNEKFKLGECTRRDGEKVWIVDLNNKNPPTRFPIVAIHAAKFVPSPGRKESRKGVVARYHRANGAWWSESDESYLDLMPNALHGVDLAKSIVKEWLDDPSESDDLNQVRRLPYESEVLQAIRFIVEGSDE